MYTRRFRLGTERYMTRAFIENGYVIITQSLRIDNTRIDNRSEVVLSKADFDKMCKTLAQS
jgi:hypothetical protein